MNDDNNSSERAEPWWRVGPMWLVAGGPAAVVVAGFVTLALALHGADVPLAKVSAEAAESMTPATQARNHAVSTRR